MLNNSTYQGETVARKFTFKDENGDLYDPSTVTIKVKTPTGTVAATQNLEDLTKMSTGVYKFRFNLPEDAAVGVWKIDVAATYALTNLSAIEVFTFDVVAR